jgi:pyruvate dehydrogenase E2 component (dihydrolipoamide acetyltransferase)
LTVAKEVIMPKFGFTQETAELVAWLKHEGEAVEQGEPIAEVTTDKVNMEVEAPASGVLAGTRVQVGEVVPVTSVIAYILAPGESRPAAAPPQAPAAAGRATPVAQRMAADAGIDLNAIPADAAGRITRQAVERYLAQRSAAPPRPGDGRVRAAPAARRLAREHGLDLATVPGSGPRGRVQSSDVRAALADRETPPAASAQPSAVGDTVIPLAGMRRTIAERMQQSYQTAPHITFTVEADMSAALALRQELNARATAAGEPPVSVTAILVKLCAWALRRHRWLNASLADDGIHLHSAINIGVAVALDEGLIVPVVREADTLGLREIVVRLRDLTERARQNRLRLEDVTGGTFTISNLGMFGIDHFTAILNPPETGLLAVGHIAKRQVVIEREGGDEVAIRPMMHLTLSVDHRVVDGATAARFLRDLHDVLEYPALHLM